MVFGRVMHLSMFALQESGYFNALTYRHPPSIHAACGMFLDI